MLQTKVPLNRVGATMFFEKLDRAIIDRVFQPVADWWNNKTGLSNFWLAKIAGAVVSVAWILLLALFFTHPGLVPGEKIGFVVAEIAFVWFTITCHKLDINRDRYETGGVMSPIRQFRPWGLFRLLWYSLAIIVVVAILIAPISRLAEAWHIPIAFIATYLGIPCGLGFAGCTPKPRRPFVAKEPKLVPRPSSA